MKDRGPYEWDKVGQDEPNRPVVDLVNTCKNNLSLEDIKEWMPGWYERIQKFLKK